MNFLNPFILFGLILSAIPLIIHLLNLRKLKTIEFSSLKFLKELQKSHIRKLKIQQWILLLLRILTIVFLVLAFSRPITTGHIPGLSQYAQSSIVILFDNSPSMNLSDQYGNRFNYAKRITKKLLDQLSNRDEIALIPIANLQTADNYSFNSNIKNISDQVSKIKVGYKTVNISQSLTIALELLKKNARYLNKEIFIISDNQSINYDDFDKTINEDLRPAIYFLQVGQDSKSDIKNISIDSIIPITRILQVNRPFNVKAKITNYSIEDKKNHIISLIFNRTKVAQKNININKNSSSIQEISANLPNEEVVLGKLEIENDALNEDNTRYFGIITPTKPRVCLVSNSENLYLNNALGANYQNSFCEFQQVSTINFNSIDPNLFDLIIFANYNSLNNSKVVNYLSNGGRAIFFGNEELVQNEELKTQLMMSDLQLSTYPPAQANIITQINRTHPIFDGVFADQSSELPDKIKILKETNTKQGTAIISTSLGSLLTENRLDKGKYLFFSVSPNPDWSNFPISTLFPVTIYRSVLYLASLPELSYNVSIGSSLQMQIPEKLATGSNYKIIDPLGNEQVLYAPNLPSGITINIPQFEIPGNYLIKNNENKPVGVASANINPRESNLSALEPKIIMELVRSKFKKNISVAFIEEMSGLNKQIQKVRTGSELWQIFLILALLTALSEMVIQRATKEH